MGSASIIFDLAVVFLLRLGIDLGKLRLTLDQSQDVEPGKVIPSPKTGKHLAANSRSAGVSTVQRKLP